MNVTAETSPTLGAPSRNPSVQTIEATESKPAQVRRHPGRVRSLVQILIGFIMLSGVSLALPGSAHALDIGGCGTHCDAPTFSGVPGSVIVDADCIAGRITVMPAASPDINFNNGQYIAWRYNFQDRRTGTNYTSGWSSWSLLPGGAWQNGNWVTSPVTPLSSATVSVARGHSWLVSVQVARWDGYTSHYIGWYGPSGYSHGSSFRNWADCTT